MYGLSSGTVTLPVLAFALPSKGKALSVKGKIKIVKEDLEC